MSYFINPVHSVGLRTLIYCYMTSLLRGFLFSRSSDETQKKSWIPVLFDPHNSKFHMHFNDAELMGRIYSKV
jgi:hypothetical protein